MNNPQYRPDIDGLRAFAVLAVILFHLDVSLVSGGFVGVDVFFVISGFLITRIIRDEILTKKSFNFSNFYLRRARRILPALFFTLILSFVLGYYFFAPQHFERFGGSLVHAVLSISNFFFWSEADYFNTASEFKPLLHTWSLGIEEQFYMIWPLFLVLLLMKTKRFVPLAAVVFAGVASLLLNFIFSDGSSAAAAKLFPKIFQSLPEGPTTIFFLTPFRVFEFAIGASMVWLVKSQPKSKIFLEPLVLIGLFMIGYPVVTYTNSIIFPSYNALLPCLGTALLIYSGTAQHCGILLRNPIAVKTGLISYSLYLIHWPLIVFYKYWKIDDLRLIDKSYIIVVAIFSAMFMYKFVEQPFRQNFPSTKLSNRVFGSVCALVAIILIIPGVKVWQENGWHWRFHDKLMVQLDFEPHHYDNYVWDRHDNMEVNFANNGKPKVMVIGDSMAADFVNVLGESNNLEKFDLITRTTGHECKPVFPVSQETYKKFMGYNIEKCKQQHEVIINSPMLEEADSVILATLWESWDIKLIDKTVTYLKSRGVKQVAIVGRKDQSMNGIKFNAKFALRKSAHRVRTPIAQPAKKYNNEITLLNSDFLYIDLLDLFCDDSGCQRVTKNGFLIIYDKTHLSRRGAQMIGIQATGSEWMKSLLQKS